MNGDPATGPAQGPVQVKISGTSAVLLTRLAERMGTDDGGQVLMTALGLLDMALSAKAGGRRLAFYDPKTLDFSEVAF